MYFAPNLVMLSLISLSLGSRSYAHDVTDRLALRGRIALGSVL